MRLRWTTAIPAIAIHAVTLELEDSTASARCSPDLHGCGAGTIVSGDKGKGDAEIFSINDIRYAYFRGFAKYSSHHLRRSSGAAKLILLTVVAGCPSNTSWTHLSGQTHTTVAGLTLTTVKAVFVCSCCCAPCEMRTLIHFTAPSLKISDI